MTICTKHSYGGPEACPYCALSEATALLERWNRLSLTTCEELQDETQSFLSRNWMPNRVPAQPAVPMHLECPECKLVHVDAVDEQTGIDWSTRPHKTHLCLGCGHLWRPADCPTIGVQPAAPTPDTYERGIRGADGRIIDRYRQPATQEPSVEANAEVRHWADKFYSADTARRSAEAQLAAARLEFDMLQMHWSSDVGNCALWPDVVAIRSLLTAPTGEGSKT